MWQRDPELFKVIDKMFYDMKWVNSDNGGREVSPCNVSVWLPHIYGHIFNTKPFISWDI